MLTRLLGLTALLCVSVVALIFAQSTLATPLPTGTETATPVSTDEPTAEVTESATAEVTPAVLVGDPVRGEDIFRHGLYGAPPCLTCHSPVIAGRGGAFSIGPGLKDVSERGATRIEGFTAPQYIEDSIRHPAHYVVIGFSPIMPTIFGEQYSDQDIADLVAFLMTL